MSPKSFCSHYKIKCLCKACPHKPFWAWPPCIQTRMSLLSRVSLLNDWAQCFIIKAAAERRQVDFSCMECRLSYRNIHNHCLLILLGGNCSDYNDLHGVEWRFQVTVSLENAFLWTPDHECVKLPAELCPRFPTSQLCRDFLVTVAARGSLSCGDPHIRMTTGLPVSEIVFTC